MITFRRALLLFCCLPYFAPSLHAGFFTSACKIIKELNRFNNKKTDECKRTFDNFHAVEKGVFYRSQQLSDDDLEFYIIKYGIKTLINLRGDEETDWWKKERAVAEKHNVCFFSLFMSAVTMTTKENLFALLTIFDTAPRPMLVHCKGGADRTGEASALWVLDQQKKSKHEARKQLSIKYGHRKHMNAAKDFLIEIWQDRQWLLTQYDPKQYPQFN